MKPEIPTVGPRVSNYIFGPVPSQSEVNLAISVMEHFVLAISPNQRDSKWVVEMLNSPTSKLLISSGLEILHKAFLLWQMDPFVKRLVFSIASDKAFWDAIMKNELVQELGKKPLRLDESTSEDRGNETRNLTGLEAGLAETILQKIWEIVRAKVVELVESFRSLMNKMFPQTGIENRIPVEGCDEQLREKVEASFLLSVVITLILIVVRASIA